MCRNYSYYFQLEVHQQQEQPVPPAHHGHVPPQVLPIRESHIARIQAKFSENTNLFPHFCPEVHLRGAAVDAAEG